MVCLIRRTAAVALALVVLIPTQSVRGQNPASQRGGTFFLRLATPGESSVKTPSAYVMLMTPGLNTFYIPLDRLKNLADPAQWRDGSAALFELRRDAGTIRFEGTIERSQRDPRVSGTFTFVPDPTFATELARRGMTAPTLEQQFSLARHGVELAYLDALHAQGYQTPSTPALVNAGMSGADMNYLEAMSSLGYHLGTIDALVHLANHVTPEYAKAVNTREGRRVPAQELISMRNRSDSGDAAPRRVAVVSVAGASETPLTGRWTMKPLRTGQLEMELFWTDNTNWRRTISAAHLTTAAGGATTFQLIQDAGTFKFEGSLSSGSGTFAFEPNRAFDDTLRAIGIPGVQTVTDHQLKNLAYGMVSANDIRAFMRSGFTTLSYEDVRDFAIYQVTPEYVDGMRAAGIKGVDTPRGVIDLRHAGVSVELARALVTQNPGLDVDELVRIASRRPR